MDTVTDIAADLIAGSIMFALIFVIGFVGFVVYTLVRKVVCNGD